MNILYIAHERNMGGASKCLIDLATGMRARGHNVYVVVPVRNCNVQKELERRGIIVIPIFFVWWQYPVYWNHFLKVVFRFLYSLEFIAVDKIGKYIKKYNIDIIHSNSSVIDIGMRVSLKYGIRHIWHFREFGDLDYQLEYFNGKAESIEKINHSASKVVFISNSLYKHYSQYLIKEISQIIYDGIDLSYCQAEPKVKSGRVVFLVSGFLHRNKRQDIAIDAAGILNARHISGFELWIAGQPSAMRDSKKYTERLKEKAVPLGDKINFLGYVTDMVGLRQKACVEVVPSEEEAFGRVTVEAMMSRMPVIGSDSGANPELIVPGETGLLFKRGDAESLADQMQRMIENPEMISHMGDQAYERAVTNFGLNKNLDQIEQLYRQKEKNNEYNYNRK